MCFHQWRFRRVVAAALLSMYVTGCTSWKTQEVSPEQVVTEEPPSRVRLTLASGTQVVVDQPQVSGDTLRGFDNGIPVEIPLANVSSVETHGADASKTGRLAFGIILGLGAAAAVALALYTPSYN